MTSGYRVNPPETILKRLGVIALAAASMIAGLLVGAAFEYGAKPSDGIAYVAFFGTLMSIPLMAILGAVLWICHLGLRWITRGRINEYGILVVAIVIGIALAAEGIVTSRPLHRVREYVVNPVPASLTDLDLHRSASFSDGSAWMFHFRVTADDFQKLVDARALEHIPVDWKQRRRDASDAGEPLDTWMTMEDHPLIQYWPNVYQRPEGALFFKGKRIFVVADPTKTNVYVYVDRWRRPIVGE